MDIVDNSALITAGVTTDVECNFTGNVPSGDVTAGIVVISGTFKFNVGKSADAAGVATYTAGDKLFLTFDPNANRGKALHFKAAGGADTFKIHI